MECQNIQKNFDFAVKKDEINGNNFCEMKQNGPFCQLGSFLSVLVDFKFSFINIFIVEK